jgi:hypothetical protein
MIVRSKIEAIKEVRMAACKTQIVRNEQTCRMELIPGIGLKDAKDLVEAICDMAVRDFIESKKLMALRVGDQVHDLVRDGLNVVLRYEPMQRG